jgi:hypothetical protein
MPVPDYPIKDFKMDLLHYPINTSVGATILVTLDQKARVRLLDALNYHRYRRGEQHDCYSELAQAFSLRLQVPRTGCWHVIIDSGRPAKRVHASVQVIE